MHFARQNAEQPHMRRFSLGTKGELEERDPSLLNLPINLPSIPLIGPILTPLIGGSTPTNTRAQAPSPTPPASSGGSSGGDGSSGGNGSSGGDSGGNNGGSTGNNGNGSGENGGSGSGESKGGSTGTGGGNNGSTADQGGSSGKGSPPSTAGSDEGSNGSDGASSGGDSGLNEDPTDPLKPTDNETSHPDKIAGDSATSTSNGGENSNSTKVTGVINAASGNTPDDGSSDSNPSDGSSGSDSSKTAHGTIVSSVASHQGAGKGGGSSISSGNGSSPTSGPGNGSPDEVAHNGLSTGSIVAIVVVACIVFLGVFLFWLRRRSMLRRSDRRNMWWSNRNASNRSIGRGAVDGTTAGTVSARSSFATTYDHGLSPRLTLNFNDIVPEVPPMAEIRYSPPATARAPASLRPLLIDISSPRRASVQSAKSSSSDQDAQYLVIHSTRPDGQLLDVPTPMSVRPFSPSESFSFPKPPRKQSGDWDSVKSKRQSEAASTDHIPPVPSLQTVPALPNPFDDPDEEPKDASEVSEDANPFADVQLIMRPFVPTLDDELAVMPGDKIRVLQLFDDGWAFVERAVVNEQMQSGLIPIDCLRGEDQDLPTFIATKRVSSYSEVVLAI